MTLALTLLLAMRPLWTDASAAKERPTAPPISIATLVKSSMPAVVGIVATTARGGGNDPFRDFLERMSGQGGSGPSETPVRGIGTGFFIRSDGLIATNGHVIEGATDITVQVGEDERVYRATLVGHDDATDLALLRIEGDKPFPVLTLGESDRALELSVLLLEKPGSPWQPPPPAPGLRRDQEPFGFAVEEPAAADAHHGHGLRVTSVDLRSCAYRAGVREGDVILEIDGHAMADKVVYRTVVSGMSGIARLYVRRGSKALFFGLRREAPVAAREKVLTVPAGSAGDAAP